MINSIKFGGNTHSFTLPYGVCSTAAATAAKTVTVDNFSLETGATVIIKFTNANTAASPTLNVNNTGAKPIYRYGTTAASTGASTTAWRAGAIQLFTYDSTGDGGWYRDFWENTTYSAATTSANGLMSSTDKKRVDAFAGTTSLGSMSGKTKADLQTALDTWLNSYCNIPNATAIFSASNDWITVWNSSDTTKTISAGGQWTVSIIAQYSTKAYTQLRFAYYSDEQIVYVHRSNSTWGTAHQAAFKDDLPSIDSSMSTSSTNPVQNKVVQTALNGKLSITGGTLSGKLTFSGTAADTAQIAFSREGYNYIIFPSNGNLGLATGATGNDIVVGVSSSGMSPYTDNVKTLGTSDRRWKNVYATTFTGALSGNASTATKLATARTISLTGDVTGSGSFDGSGNLSITATVADNSHDHISLKGNTDNRSVATAPSDYNGVFKVAGLKTNSVINSPSSDTYSGVIGFRQWSDNSGGNAHELAFNDSGLYMRSGATTTWGNWEKFITSASIGSQSVASATKATKLATARTIDGVSFDGSAAISHYGICETEAGTQEKVVSCAGFTLVDGARILVKFKNTNSASTPSLNVNNTGAKTMLIKQATPFSTDLVAGCVYEFIYDSSSSSYYLNYGRDTNTNTDTKVTQTVTTTNAEYPLLTSSTANASATTTTTARFATGVTMNPSSGTITATTFKGALSGNASTATKATQDGSGNTITSTYLNKTTSTAQTVAAAVTFNNTTASSSKTTGAVIVKGGVGVSGSIYGNKVYGAVWNDYAEYRQGTEEFEAGRVVCENGDDTLSLATERLQPGANIVSDTFGFAIGETETAKTPLAVSGRVLAYPYEDRESYKPGDAVCAAPNGTVSKMTREEIREYPERIIGTVSAVPTYETWGENNVLVNGRIWIKVK